MSRVQVKGTILFSCSTSRDRYEALHKAAQIIREGGIIAFPTETVYGLGANALNPHAVRKIFGAKGRPPDNPLIVHVSGLQQVKQLVEALPQEAQILAEKFWPGPLTMVLKKSTVVPEITTANLTSVAVRVPGEPLALKLIELAGPIAAPSANLSGRPSPTSAQHVIEDMAGRIDGIIDGGECTIGVESTVVNLLSNPPALLRPGGVTLEELQEVLGQRLLDLTEKSAEEGPPLSPGMKYTHYSPRTPLYLVEGKGEPQKRQILALVESFKLQDRRIGLLVSEELSKALTEAKADNIEILSPRNKPLVAAHKLFSALRKLDAAGIDVIVAEGFEEKEIGHALMNRLRKAAVEIVEPPKEV